MKNLKIRTKILSTFIIVLILTILLGSVSVVSIYTMSRTADNYVKISIPATEYLLNARRTISNFQVDILESTAVMTQEQFDEVVTNMNNHRTEFFQDLDEFIKLDPQFQSEVDEIHTLMDSAADIRERILAESEKRTTEGNAAAFQIYEDEYLPALNNVTAILENLSTELDDAISARHADGERTESVVTILIFAVIAVALVIVIVLSLLLTRLIVKPINEIDAAMNKISNGRISEAKVSYKSKDELGELAESTRRTVTFFQNVMPDIAMICNNLGDGNFNISTAHHEYYVGETNQILQSMRYTRNNLSAAITQVGEASEQLLGGSEQVACGAQALAQGATEQASSIEELAATINELSDKVHTTADNARTAQEYSSEASAGVKESTEHMAELVKAMNDINDTSDQISQIIKAIEDISFQTNILSLNAAIEAARAGAAGKGFAVVADEVRNLAGKSAEAAHNTTELIQNSLRAVQAGMEQLSATSASLDNVVLKEAQVAAMVSEITEATVEQSEAIKQITLGVDQISEVVQTNSATSEQSAAAAEELSSQANMLKELVGQFTLYEKQ